MRGRIVGNARPRLERGRMTHEFAMSARVGELVPYRLLGRRHGGILLGQILDEPDIIKTFYNFDPIYYTNIQLRQDFVDCLALESGHGFPPRSRPPFRVTRPLSESPSRGRVAGAPGVVSG